ncbi:MULTISPECIES: hypothetical protein [Micromonospora]|uniref:Uncharacterized protein n=1 Tax=Micromonospora yangpuensis TaxID=683228 RepID=A0A1C6UVH6_9ACTN|nr:hypothetical protein [Micromonospora yangpuensis]GGM26012.1 hypothetical protein GCM10012279_50670 [Micromonospora yangpuensis]SCL58047.1 hypothetical protein GA0070617_3702 [Micromonospora yangpuensis]
MTPVPHGRQVASGTWGGWRARRRRAPDHRSYDFSPVDTRPPGSAAGDALTAQREFQADLRGGLHPAVVMAKQAGRLIGGRRRERARQQQGPRWSISRPRVAAGRFLDEVARYCLDRGRWDPDVEAGLIAVSADFADPVRRMGQARDRMDRLGDRVHQPAAVAVTEELRHAARAITDLVATHYRAVPPPVDLPAVELRLTGRQRRAALVAVGEASDRHLGAWYAFVCSSPAPEDTGTQLRHLTELLPVAAQVDRWRACRQRCGELGEAAEVERATVLAAVRDLRAAIGALEEAVYRASTGS